VFIYATIRYGSLSDAVTQKKCSFEFTTTRLFMKIWHTGSSRVVIECRRHFNFLPIKLQLIVCRAEFLQSFTVSVNTLYLLFEHQALNQLRCIFLHMATCTRLVSLEMSYVNNLCFVLYGRLLYVH